MDKWLSDQEQDFYQQNGYLHIRGLIDKDEAEGYRNALHALAERRGTAANSSPWSSVRAADPAGQLRITRCHDVQYECADFGRLILDPRLTGRAQALIGPNVQLHHTKMFIKPPESGAPFPMHQDHPYFPHEKHSVIAVIIHFDDAPEEKGCLRVVPGSHKRGPIEAVGQDHHLPEGSYAADQVVALPAKAGDAIFFSYFLFHGSGVNVSDEPRTTLLVQMRDPLDRPLTEGHASRGQGLMLAGINPERAPFRHAWNEAGA